VRCANCHRRRTAERGNWFRARERSAVEVPARPPCFLQAY
jgi:hypothetical protein